MCPLLRRIPEEAKLKWLVRDIIQGRSNLIYHELSEQAKAKQRSAVGSLQLHE